MLALPQVQLDTTLADLFALGDAESQSERIAIVLCAASSEVAPTSHLAQNSKFLYQDSTFSTTPKSISSEKYHEIQRATAIKYLSLVPQHDAFAAGDMPVILFNLDTKGEKQRSMEEAEKTVSSLVLPQRPRLLFFPGPKQISLKENEIDLLMAKMELDELEGYPVAISLDTHYFLNSKAALATSGLPTPKSTLLELDDFSVDPASCCGACKSLEDTHPIPSNCTGPRFQWLQSKISHLISILSRQQLPFVIKNQQTFGGGGTFVISNEEQLSELKTALSTRILPKLLSQVRSTNSHLKPATLILSEMVMNPIGDWGLTFFVTRNGDCIFLAVTQQIVDSSKAWIGSTVQYTMQDSLKKKFAPVMEQIGAWLHGYGYFGPCGADILETARSPNDDETTSTSELNIVDLNVRTSGSLVLGLMKGHFSDRRGLYEASSFSVTAKMTRNAFIDKFENDFQDGSMVIVSWYEDQDSGVSYGNILIGARSKEDLERQGARVKEIAAEVHF